MAQLLQKGTTVIAASSVSNTGTLGVSVNTSNAFLDYSYEVNDTDAEDSCISGELTNGTTVTFERTTGGGAVTIRWAVFEDSDINVQEYEILSPGGTTNVAISAIVEARSSIISLGGTANAGDGSSGSDTSSEHVITSTTNVAVTTTGTTRSGLVRGQVIQWPSGASVQEVSFSSNVDSNQTITAVAMSETAVWGTNYANSGAWRGDEHWAMELTSTTNLGFTRSLQAGTTNATTAYVVSIPSYWTVQHVASAYVSGDTTLNLTISAVSVADTFVRVGTADEQTSGSENSSGSASNYGGWSWRGDVTTTTNVALTRNTTGTAGYVSAQAIQVSLALVNVTAYGPPSGGSGVCTRVSFELTFDVNVQAGTGDFRIRRFSDDVLFQTIAVGSVSIASNVVTIPHNTLDINTEYYVEADAGVLEDLSANDWNGIASKTTWNFTAGGTTPPGEAGAPVVETANVANGNAGAGFSHTLTGNSNRIVVVMTDDESTTPVSGVTYNGVAMTLIIDEIAPGVGNAVTMWGILEANLPGAGTYTVAVTGGGDGGTAVSVVEINNVVQTLPLEANSDTGSNTTGGGVGTITSSATAPADSSLGIAATGHGGTVAFNAPIGGWTRLFTNNPSSAVFVGAYQSFTSGGSKSITETSASSWNRAAQVIALFEVGTVKPHRNSIINGTNS